MIKKYTFLSAFIWMFLFITGVFVTSCNSDDDGGTGNLIQLNSFGPSPALRGGELKFIGTNLDKVTSIMLPGNVEVTNFMTKTPELLIIEVPEETVEGIVVLNTPDGTIETLTILGISEPITIASVTPETVRPGEKIAIVGTYLNLIEQVTFSNNKVVIEFVSQSKTKIEVLVPMDAQTGILTLSTGVETAEEIPIEVETEANLEVVLPMATTLSPTAIRAGAELTISGTDLDLATVIVFPGGTRVEKENFELTEDGDLIVTVPSNSQDGNVVLIAPSLVETESAVALQMVAPTITAVTPNPAKTGENITVTGTNLDLISSVTFGGDKSGEILDGGSATQITVKVPEDATEAAVMFGTNANKSVESAEILTLQKPVIASISPMTVKTQENITINGSDLDLVAKVVFQGNVEGTIVSKSETQLVVTVSPRSESGKITLTANNGTEVMSTQSLTVEPGNVPTITNMPATSGPGQMITIEGTKLDLTVDVIFPGNIKATSFGMKTATKLEVVVPADVELGVGRISFVTSEGEITESPEINFQGSIATYIFDESLNSGWQQWGGWGTALQDLANTEHPERGSKAIKIEYSDAYGALQLHPVSASVFEGYSALVLSIYGGPGSNGARIAIQVKDGSGATSPEPTMTIVEGAYTTFEIPLDDLNNPASVAELYIKNYGTAPNIIYIDDMGLR